MPDPKPSRNVRVGDTLWNAAQAKARAEGTTLSEIIRRALERYVGKR